MANNKRNFFKTISLAHWHVKLSIAAHLPMVHSFRWEQTCELVINVKNNVVRKIRRYRRSPVIKKGDACLFKKAVVACLRKDNAQGTLLNTFQLLG